MLQSPKTPADQSIVRYLLPKLIEFVTSTEGEDPEKARALISHGITTFVATLPNAQRGIGMSLVVPALLSRASTEVNEGNVYLETSARLLELAASDQVGFRSVVAGMTDSQKVFMDEVIKAGRQAGAGSQKVAENDGKEPTIALRMNFGGA